MFQEFNKHDKEPSKYIKQWKGIKPKTGAPYTCDIGYERFLGPEVCSPSNYHSFSYLTWVFFFPISVDILRRVTFFWLLLIDFILGVAKHCSENTFLTFLQVFFNPEIYSSDFTTPLPVVIDKCIQSAPIDTRRSLYKVMWGLQHIWADLSMYKYLYLSTKK